MLELFNQTIHWWHWIILGTLLFILEIATGTFVLLGLSLASIAVGVVALALNTTFLINIFIWIILASIFVFIWQKYFHNPTYSDSGQSDYGLKIKGIANQDMEPGYRGQVSLDESLVGNRKWAATSTTFIKKGTRIKIVEIKGQLLEVEPT